MTSLNGTLPLNKWHDRAVMISKHLYLNVTSLLDTTFKVNCPIPKRRGGF